MITAHLTSLVQQEPALANGPVPSAKRLSRGSTATGAEAAPHRVRDSCRCRTDRDDADYENRFMFDKIMPLSDAPEGYALFEQRKTQKVVFAP